MCGMWDCDKKEVVVVVVVVVAVVVVVMEVAAEELLPMLALLRAELLLDWDCASAGWR